MKTGRRCERGLGHAQPRTHSSNKPADFFANGVQTLSIATSKSGGQEQLNIARSQGAVAADAFAVSAIELV
jgi:hypothetical protein